MARKDSEDVASEPGIARGDDANGITNLTQICVQTNGGDTSSESLIARLLKFHTHQSKKLFDR